MTKFNFANPEFFWLFSIIPVVLVWLFFTKNYKVASLKSSDISFYTKTGALTKIQPLLDVLRVCSIIFLIIALARPQSQQSSVKTKTTKGIDIVMAIDVSSSMLARDLKPNRLSALTNVASEFSINRFSDRVGLVVYAGESYTKTPITSDKALVVDILNNISYDKVINDGTAIGMGLATSVNRLRQSKANGKVIILLTDGVNNSGFVDPMTAASLAKSLGIKVYTIGLGSNGSAPAPVAIKADGTFVYQLSKVEIDEELLKSIANETGGSYYRATDNKKLQEIYDEIDKLEKTEIDEIKYTKNEELFRPYVIIAIVLIFTEWLLRFTVFKSPLL